MKSTLTAFSLWFLCVASAVAQQEPITKIAEIEGVTEYRLGNGCRLLLLPDESSSSVTINMTVFVGSRHEGYGETGMAHLLEHMLFKGTPKHGDIDKELKELGVLDMNGTTWYDRTNYYETLPASDENMDWAISMEADRLLNCYVRAEDLASEMTVVRSEFERGENSPIRILSQRLMANAYEWHNYGKSVIGNKADIERVPIHRLRAFYKKYYRPDNIMVLVAGKFDTEKALDSVKQHFGSLEKPETEIEPTYTTEPVQDGERIVHLRRTGDVPVVGVGYHIPAVAHADYAPVQVMDWILGDEPSGRLYNDLVKNKQASMVFSNVESGFDPGMVTCFAQVENNIELDDFRAKIIASIERMAEDGVTDAEVARAVADIGKEKEDDVTNSSQFAMTLSNWSAYGDWRLYYVDRDRIAAVTTADVNRVAAKYLKSSNRTVAVFMPTKKPDRATIPTAPRIADLVKDYKGKTAISAGEAFEPTPENIAARVVRGELSTGVKYTLLPKKSRGDRFYLRLTLRYGTEESLNSPETIKACSMLARLITKGTENFTRQELEDKLTQLKAELRVSGENGVLNFAVEGHKENLADTLDVLYEVLRRPTFPADELELLKSESVASYETMKSDPQFQAITTLSRKLTPVTSDNIHYVPTVEEEIARAKAATVDHIRLVYDAFLSSSHGELTVLGSFENEVVLAKLESALDGWKSQKPYQRIASKRFDFEPESLKIETPDKANAFVLMGANLDVRSDDPDWEALFIANDILGGGSLSSRLGERVREQEGLSYAVGCQFRAESLDRSAMFMSYAITNPTNREKLVATIDGVFDRFLESGVNSEELEAAKTSYAKALEKTFSDDKQLLSILHRYRHLDRDETFLRRRLARVAGLTKEQVDAAARKLLNGKKFVIVAAGDFANAKDADKAGQK